MLALKEFRSHLKGLPDLLQWGFMVDKGVILNKDGSLTSAIYFRGQDLGSATQTELTLLSARVNAGFKKLGTGWLIHIDSIRVKAIAYPGRDQSFFPDPTTDLIESERRAQHETEGAHFDNVYAMAFTYLLPKELQSKLTALFIDDDTGKSNKINYTLMVERYKENVKNVMDSFATELQMRQMDSDELLTYLHTCLTGESHPVTMPQLPMYLDAILGSKDFYTGLAPRIGKKHIRVVTVYGFPGDTTPGILDRLNRLPFEYRWSTRFIPLDPQEAEKKLSEYRRNWFQKRHGLIGLIKGAAGGGEQTWTNGDAVKMAADADSAIGENSANVVRYGYYTNVIVVMSDDFDEANQNASEISKLLGNSGFPSFIEDMNAVEAFLGSLPSHGFQNVRRPLMHSLNLADLLPLTAVWSGHNYHPCSFYPPKSPPLLHGATNGGTPFKVSLHVKDVGHFGIFGPTGAGKSTLLNILIAQHFRYPSAQVFSFDYGYSTYALCEASGGIHYDIAADDQEIGFCPLGQIDTPKERTWAAEYIITLVTLRLNADESLSLAQKNEITRAVNSLAENTTLPEQRTITHFVGTVQDNMIKEALKYYQIGSSAAGNMLDATHDSLATVTNKKFFVFEMSHLFSLGEALIIPVMLYIFRQIEKRVSKSIPTLIPIDEAFRSFGHPIALARLSEWLEVMRKENAAVGFATQNIDTVLKSPIGTTILQNSASTILLPNPKALDNKIKPLYESLSLNDRQITNLAAATQKREYYLMNADGQRMFDLGLGKVALAFVGIAGKESALKVKSFKQKYGDEWVYQWLIAENVPQDWANYWLKLKRDKV